MSCLSSVFTKTQRLRDDSGGFFFDNPEALVDGHPRPLVSVTHSRNISQEEIDEYLKSLKRRAQESRHVGGSSTQEEFLIPHCSELWMLPVPVHCFHCIHDLVTENVLQAGMEKTLAESLLEISQKTHEDCGIKIYHVPYNPRRIYCTISTICSRHASHPKKN